jgi:hypothetical protein
MTTLPGGHVALEVAVVLAGVRLRHQHVDVLPHQLPALVPEELRAQKEAGGR